MELRRTIKVVRIVLCATLPLSGCVSDEILAPAAPVEEHVASDVASNAEHVAGELIEVSGWSEDITGAGSTIVAETSYGKPRHLHQTQRRVISDDIVHYSFRIAVGPGPHDFIGLHRVVKERRAYKPIRTHKALFMVPGDGTTFDSAFLASLHSASIPDDHALPVFLAKDEVDVWGIDLGWSLIPEDTQDVSFMQDWGVARDVRDMRLGMAVARLVRGMTGHGFGRLYLLGFSRGGLHGYAYLNEETQHPRWDRHVAGFIPVDIAYKTDVGEQRSRACAIAGQHRAMLDAGLYADPSGSVTKTIGTLAAQLPDAPSPVLAGLNNMQAALVLGSATFKILDFAPLFHWMGGTFDANGIPTGLQFTQVDFMMDFFRGFSPYEPVRMMYEGEATICGDVDLPYDDHLDEISVPILSIGAHGGLGDFSAYTLSLLASTDVTTIRVQLHPPEHKLVDYGHVDLLTADNAETLVWRPISSWIEQRSQRTAHLSRWPAGG